MSVKKKLLNSPFNANGRSHIREGNWDTDYESIEIVDVVKKTGDGEDDYVLSKKVIVSYTPIQDVIDADKDSAGVAPILKQYAMTGDESLLPIDKGSQVDLVGAPSSLMEVEALGQKAKSAFGQLPSELVDGLDMKSFVESMTQEKFNQFIDAVAARQAKKQEVKSDE